MSRRAVVVFLGTELVDGPAWYARWLKPGFVHCFMLIHSRGRWWIKVEGKFGMPCVSCVELSNVASHYRQQGATVVETTVSHEKALSLLVARTCVGLIKAFLGIRSMAVTPFGLYKHITRAST